MNDHFETALAELNARVEEVAETETEAVSTASSDLLQRIESMRDVEATRSASIFKSSNFLISHKQSCVTMFKTGLSLHWS